jgi:hypothetical protein
MKINENVLDHEFNGEIVLFHVSSGNYFSLNEIGKAIWLGLSEGLEVDSIIERITGEYDADYDVIKSDVEEMLSKMKEEGLIS